MLTLPSQHKQSSILSALRLWWHGHVKNQSKLFELGNMEIEDVAHFGLIVLSQKATGAGI